MRLLIIFVLCLWLIVACKDRVVEEKTTAEVMAEEEENKLLEDAIERGFYSIENELVDTDSVEFNNSIASHFSDIRDGKEYKTVKIGEQVWMAENLAFKPETGNYWAYDNDKTNVPKYGYLYDWETACNVCPNGWHLPTDRDWTVLADYLGGHKYAGKLMRSNSGWEDKEKYKGISGTNESGFNAFPGGFRYPISEDFFSGIGIYVYWWTSSEYSVDSAWNHSMYYDNSIVYRINSLKSYGFSIRCIKD